MAVLSELVQEAIREVAGMIRGSRHGVVLSGAGISTPSGIADFRSPENGIWNEYDPMEVASLASFRRHPERFYLWLQPLAKTILEAEPNPAHYALAQLQNSGYLQTIISQNIDGLHSKAGSTNILNVHGQLDSLTCLGCYRKYPNAAYIQPYLQDCIIPHCPECHQLLKPDVILFGEQLPVRTWLSASQASRKCDLMMVIGSSLEVMPVARLPLEALENGAHLILINQTPTYLDSRADVLFNEDAAQILPLIVSSILE